MIASLSGRRRRGAPDDRSLGCVLRPSGLATVRGAREAPGPTYTRARGTKNEPTSGPTPRSTIDPFHPARVRLRPVGNSYRDLFLERPSSMERGVGAARVAPFIAGHAGHQGAGVVVQGLEWLAAVRAGL